MAMLVDDVCHKSRFDGGKAKLGFNFKYHISEFESALTCNAIKYIVQSTLAIQPLLRVIPRPQRQPCALSNQKPSQSFQVTFEDTSRKQVDVAIVVIHSMFICRLVF
jgi:hypothetical protein